MDARPTPRGSGDALHADPALVRGGARLAHEHCRHGMGEPASGVGHDRRGHMALQGTTLQSRVEASLHPHFDDMQWAGFFRDRFSGVAGHGAVISRRSQPEAIAVQGVK